MGRRASIGMTFLILLQLVSVNASSALAQAGSTGGTVGKQDKSMSGGVEAEQPRPKLTRSRALPLGADGRQKLFIKPTIHGVRVDRCRHFGTECDEPAATEWCRSKGFARATAWNWEHVSNTVGQSDGHRCSTGLLACGGFSKIACE
jgi:hypothetical protein